MQFQLAHIFTTFCRVIQIHTHTRLHSETTAPGLPFILILCPNNSEMSDSVKDKPVSPENPLRSDRIHIILRSVSESRAFTVRGDCTVTQVRKLETVSVVCRRSSAILKLSCHCFGVCVCFCVRTAETVSVRAAACPSRAAGADPLRTGSQGVRTHESP